MVEQEADTETKGKGRVELVARNFVHGKRWLLVTDVTLTFPVFMVG